MTSLGSALHLIAVGAYATGINVDVTGIEGVELLDATLVFFHQLAGSLEVSETFLTGIGHHKDAAIGGELVLNDKLGHHQKHRERGGIVTYARGVEFLTVILQLKGRGVGEHRVGVRREYNDIVASIAVDGTDTVECLVDGNAFGALHFQPFFAEGGALLLMIRGGGNSDEIR